MFPRPTVAAYRQRQQHNRLHRQKTEEYSTDRLTRKGTLLGIAAAGLGGAVFTLAAWFVLRMTSWPAFNRSNMTLGLGTAVTVAVIIVVGLFIGAWLLDEQRAMEHRKAGSDSATTFKVHRPRWRVILTYLVSYLSPAGIVISTTAIPLSATRLYLDGTQVDQGFRTQFLTRMAETWANQDMNYWDLPTFYPIGWFWGGGRLANLLGIPGWEAYQPWALISIAAAACVLVPVWQRLTGSLAVATGIALVSTCVTLVMSSEEPYGAIVALGVPAATFIARRALSGSWFATLGLTLFLGVSATMYTLFTAVTAVTIVGIAALYFALINRTWIPVRHLAIIGFGSILIALTAWAPYLWAVLTGHPTASGTAPHYLPPEGAQLPIPFLAPSVIGALCLIGLIYLVVRAQNIDVRTVGISLIGFYLWAVVSMLATLTGTTLLGFRIDILITLQLSTAGVLALAEFRLLGVHRLYPSQWSERTGKLTTRAMVILLCAGGLLYAQSIPVKNMTGIDNAYSNTDGYGERADQYNPDAGRFYPEIDEEIRSHGYVPDQTVIFSDEINFTAFHPYHGFQGFTSHYANPLGEFPARNEAIESWATRSWADLEDPNDFIDALGDTPWRQPDVFIFRGDVEDPERGWKTHINDDIFPNNPNVRYRSLMFNPASFLDAPDLWNVSQIGPFVVASRIID